MSFIKGMELFRSFCGQVVEPLIQAALPGMPHALGLPGYGSDVLGYDDTVSTDHMWGPRFLLFLREEDMHEKAALVARMQNETGLARSVSVHVHPYHDRDILVIDTDELATAAREAIPDPRLRAMPAFGTFSQIGGLVQLSDEPRLARMIAAFYRLLAQQTKVQPVTCPMS